MKYNEDSFKSIRQNFCWEDKKLCDMTNKQIENVLDDYYEFFINLKQEVVDILEQEKEYRYQNKIRITEWYI